MMKKLWISIMLTSILMGIFLATLFWLVFSYLREQKSAFSPLPDFLTMYENNQVSTVNLFFPEIKDGGLLEDSPIVNAKSALVYDITTKKTLFAKNAEEKLPMASLTKVMTAIVALENKKPNNKYIVTKENLVGENSMGLTPGEILSLEELLYGLILVSANDASEVLASNYPLGRENFIKAMNDKARSLGLNKTNFTNPSGLSGDGDQYTNAPDLLVITKYALSNFPLFENIAKTISFYIPRTAAHGDFFLENETNLLRSYPGVKGVKTGYTPESGLCLITYLEYGGHKIIGIILGSNNRRDDMRELLDYSLKSLGITPPRFLGG